MWIFLNDAFISIVQPQNSGAVDPARYLMVRGRIPGDLERLFPGRKVFQDKGTDYRFRCFVKRGDVAALIAEEVTKISYTNFKDSVPEKARHDCYLGVWSVMHREQENRRPRRRMTKQDKMLLDNAQRFGSDGAYWDAATKSWKIGKQPPFRLVKK